MFYRVLFGAVPTLLFWAIFSGAIPITSLWPTSSFSATLPHSPDEVAATLSDLRLNPSGDTTGLESQRTTDGYLWTVSHDGKPMVNYIVHLEAIDGGKSTRVTSEVQQLPAATADDAPKAFKETGLESSLFNAALEEDLNPLQPDDVRLSEAQAHKRRMNEMVVMAAAYTAGHMKEIGNEMEKNAPDADAADQMDRELKAQAAQEEQAKQGVHFEPGEPMVNSARN